VGASGSIHKQIAAANDPATLERHVDRDSSQELTTAQHYLQGNGSQRNPGEAAKLLWKAVGKQNTSAVVLLADLYARGDGVPRNCDQARLLLVTAAKKGNRDAAQRLRGLETGGCP
jgi:TPR repeat protein